MPPRAIGGDSERGEHDCIIDTAARTFDRGKDGRQLGDRRLNGPGRSACRGQCAPKVNGDGAPSAAR